MTSAIHFMSVDQNKSNIHILRPDELTVYTDKNGNIMHLAKKPSDMEFNKKTPQQTFHDAINFGGVPKLDTHNANQQQQQQPKKNQTNDCSDLTWKKKFQDYLKKTNDSQYTYPIISCVVLLSTLIVVLLSKSNKFLKFICSLVVFLFILYTIYTFKKFA